MTNERLDAIKKLLVKAAKGDWKVTKKRSYKPDFIYYEVRDGNNYRLFDSLDADERVTDRDLATMLFVCRARTIVPELIEAIEEAISIIHERDKLIELYRVELGIKPKQVTKPRIIRH